ncbi:Uncharacterised protein [Mycobacteroides abscessus subsp. abscessus]|nr:Uncharacterised protein [Mycobacteroides abscessus subsp. abscessus]
MASCAVEITRITSRPSTIAYAVTTASTIPTHAGRPCLRANPWIGCTAMVSINARNTGPRMPANAFIPATATTAAAAASSTIRPRGSDHGVSAAGRGVSTVSEATGDSPRALGIQDVGPEPRDGGPPPHHPSGVKCAE